MGPFLSDLGWGQYQPRTTRPVVLFKLSMWTKFPQHNHDEISGSHACRVCVWPIMLDAELYTTCPGERVFVFIRFNVTFLPLRPCCENMRTCFSKDRESRTTYGCVLWCSPIVYIRPYSLNSTIAFYSVTECPCIAEFFDGWRVMPHRIRALPGINLFRNWRSALQ